MAPPNLAEWIATNQLEAGYWYVKRLSGNDTQANGAHQAGPYISNNTAFEIFPALQSPNDKNPRLDVPVISSSHDHSTTANIIWYNNRLHGGTRNEVRITRLGGQQSPLLDPENTGAIALLLFAQDGTHVEVRYWVCRDEPEENIVESVFGPIEPGVPRFSATSTARVPRSESPTSSDDCWLTAEQMPEAWMNTFPTPREVLDKAISLNGYRRASVDDRLMKRRTCEFQVYRSVEYAVEMRTISDGFKSIETFLEKAQTILQRRKARSGRSLELQVERILTEQDIKFKLQANTEAGNRPDFLFPSQDAYDDSSHPSERLRMLAVKTTVKERWRQILEEAKRIPIKHLLTLQEGVSENQFNQMQEAGVRLVVPQPLHSKYPKSVRLRLMTLEHMLEDVQSL